MRQLIYWSLLFTITALTIQCKFKNKKIIVEETITPKYDEVQDFSEGFAVVSNNDKYGFIDTTGKEIIPLQYDYISSFKEGFAIVYIGDSCGVINKSGQLIVPIIYDAISPFSNGIVRVVQDLSTSKQKNIYINNLGNIVTPAGYNFGEDFSEKFAAVWKKDKESGFLKCGFINKEGKEVIPLIYDQTNSFHDGLAAVKKEGSWGFIDTTGKEIISFQYSYVVNDGFNNGFACVCRNNYDSIIFINKEGKEIATSEYYEGENGFSEGLAKIRNFRYNEDSKWGFIDTTGRQVIPFIKDAYDVTSFFNGIATIRKSMFTGIINKEGRIINFTKPYYSMGSFNEGLASVQRHIITTEFTKKGMIERRELKSGFIDTTGKEVISVEYSGASYFSEGLAVVGKERKYGFIDKKGNQITPFEYEEAYSFVNGFAAVKKYDVASRQYKWGFLKKVVL